ncbi:hypothetical protein LS70_008535 [Helicobacter sp. MIT 11-5569]|uniref:TylF/MycF/NovP-related O-methyltransferase n=1 Tax=Helicobacter sp. MIT 11-5569 TaxID=1548151 RepID=UPI0006901EE8|nr:TylF/MycF/NovP-related O-methyltransferase [Helicobacter sp. MIT 11-5569]TLD81164.1 hypothetical protein LS70_008535 [Helicobacter sp. MIT 11-5569]
MKKIVIFGVGTVAESIYKNIDFSRVEILGFVNPYTFRVDTIKEFKGYPVYAIETIKDLEYDYLLIASGNVSSVKNKIKEVGLDSKKAIAFIIDNDNDVFFGDLMQKINQEYAEFLNDDVLSEIFLNYERNYIFPVTMQHSSCKKMKESKDFVRYKQLELIAESIYAHNVEGSVAECGVYKGEFSRKINAFFPDRNLYLFDTFEGFDIKSIANEIDTHEGNIESMQVRFMDTNVDYVLNRMPFKEQCIVKKGFFPETFDLDSSEKFAFVSLDMDLYQPILDGLRVFYPRLSQGGFIMVHDYKNAGYPRCKEAVDLFCKENGVTVVPLTDFFGSALLVK